MILPDDDLPARTAVADELLEVAAEHGLVLEEAIGHTMARQAACARNDLDAVLRHLRAEDTLGQRFQLGPVQDGIQTARAMLAAIQGRLEEAEQIYMDAARTLVRRLGPDGEAVGLLGVLFTRLARAEGLAELLPMLEDRLDRYGPAVFADLVALTAARAGDLGKAREVRSQHSGQPIRPDFLRLLFTSVRASVAVELDERAEVAAIYASLLPFEDRFAGAGTGSYAMCPVASVLGDCAELLGDLHAAARHHGRAAQVARQWTHDGEWERRALAAGHRLARASGVSNQ